LRDDGRWCAVVDLGTINGKRKRRYLYGKTRKEVAEQLKIVLRDQQLGVLPTHEQQTVDQFLTAWLEQSVRVTNKPSTYESYRAMIQQHLIPTIGALPLPKLTPQHVQALLS
jgi:hypothetical protein